MTPNWGVSLPGASYDGPDPDGFMPLAELIDYFQSWADSFLAPVEMNTHVASLKKDGDGFVMRLPDGEMLARTVVVVACGRAPWMPRRMDGRDTVWWTREAGWLDRTPDKLPSPVARLGANPQATGHGGGRDLHYRTLHESGVELLGRYVGAEGSKIYFADDLAASPWDFHCSAMGAVPVLRGCTSWACPGCARTSHRSSTV